MTSVSVRVEDHVALSLYCTHTKPQYRYPINKSLGFRFRPKPMWLTPTATLPCRLWPPATANANQGPFTVSASARHSRPRKNIKYDYDDEDEHEQNLQEERNNDNQDISDWNQHEFGDSEEQAKISGSVVLLALQKATAQKTSKKIKKKTKITKPKEDKQGDATCSDYKDVKPLCIKSDWKDRLDELETQLHQLIHNT